MTEKKKCILSVKLDKYDFEKPLFSLYQVEISSNANLLNDNNIKDKMSLNSIVEKQIKNIEEGQPDSESKIYIS